MEIELGLEEEQKVKKKHRFPQNNSKKIPSRKTPGHDDIHGFWLKKNQP